MDRMIKWLVWVVVPVTFWTVVFVIGFSLTGCTDAMLGRWTGMKVGVFVLPVQGINETQTLQDKDKEGEFSTKAPTKY